MAYKFFAGIRPVEFASLELAYIDMGELGGRCGPSVSEGRCVDDLSGFSEVNGTLEVSGVELSAVGWYPANDVLEVFAKAGAFFWDGEATVRGTRDQRTDGDTIASGDDDGVSLIVGGGFHHTLFEHVNARLEYQRAFDVMGDDVNLVMLTLQVDFDTPWAAPF